MNIRQKKVNTTAVISPVFNCSPFSISDSPQYISISNIKKIYNINILKELEYQYDMFLEKKCQILQLLNVIDEVLDIRDIISMRINALERQMYHYHKLHFPHKYKFNIA